MGKTTTTGNTTSQTNCSCPDSSFVSADMRFHVCHVSRGCCAAEVSSDGKKWHALVKQEKVGDATAAIPSAVLPPKQLFLRFKPATPNSNLQIDRIVFEGKLDGKPAEGEGQTLFADLEKADGGLAIEDMSLTDGGFSGLTTLQIKVRNKTDKSATVAVTGKVSINERTDIIQQPMVSPKRATIPAGAAAEYSIAVPSRAAGEYELSLECRTQDAAATACKLSFTVENYYRSDYGKLISGGPNGA